MQQRLGVEDAATALAQLGFLHGLRDASRSLGSGGVLGGERMASAATRLPMRFTSRRSCAPRVPLDVRGWWPGRREANAVGSAGLRSHAPACHASAGYTSGWLSGLFQADVLALEVSCRALGDPECRFVAREATAWFEASDEAAEVALARLPYRALRQAVGEPPDAAPVPSLSAFDPDSPAVHVWGPVMVVPFSGPEETLHAVELIGHDPGAREVAVVVLDLAGTLVDEGFGALALERVLDAIRGWGAETVLTGISPLSEPAVASLEQPHLVARKDLPDAIALAFQVAQAARRSV